MTTDKATTGLRIPRAFNFSPPESSNSSYGRWVVNYMREHMTHTANDRAFFWRKSDALAFYRANAEAVQ